LETTDQLRQAPLVGVASWALTIGSNPFGVLGPQIFVNLPLKLAVRMNLVGHDKFLDKGLVRIAFSFKPLKLSFAVILPRLRVRGILRCHSRGDAASLVRGSSETATSMVKPSTTVQTNQLEVSATVGAHSIAPIFPNRPPKCGIPSSSNSTVCGPRCLDRRIFAWSAPHDGRDGLSSCSTK